MLFSAVAEVGFVWRAETASGVLRTRGRGKVAVAASNVMATVSMHATVTTALGGGLEVSVPQRLLPRPSPLVCNKNSSLSTAAVAAAAHEPARNFPTSAVSENAGGSSEL